MGTDMITASTTMPHGLNGRLIDLDPENIRSEIDSLVSTQTIENVIQYCHDAGHFENQSDILSGTSAYVDDDDLPDDVPDEYTLTRDDVVTMLVNAYSRVNDLADINSDTAIATVGDMSWGDAPEGYDEVCLLAESCVFDKPIYDPTKLVIPEHLSDVVRAYADSLPEWNPSRAGLLLLAETVEMLDHELNQPEVERVFRALVLHENV